VGRSFYAVVAVVFRKQTLISFSFTFDWIYEKCIEGILTLHDLYTKYLEMNGKKNWRIHEHNICEAYFTEMKSLVSITSPLFTWNCIFRKKGCVLLCIICLTFVRHSFIRITTRSLFLKIIDLRNAGVYGMAFYNISSMLRNSDTKFPLFHKLKWSQRREMWWEEPLDRRVHWWALWRLSYGTKTSTHIIYLTSCITDRCFTNISQFY
jgi:hypothetical protein